MFFSQGKKKAELKFWKAELRRYMQWYLGKEPLYGFPFPVSEEKVTGYGLRIDAAMTWLKLFQEKKYPSDLKLNSDAFVGLKVLDVGCGPFPNLFAFSHCERHGLDPLIDLYRKTGYPLDIWQKQGFYYHSSPAEKMTFPEAYFDAIVSVNAIDHVDNFKRTAEEIRRVLKKGGIIRMHVHYHKRTQTEPLQLNDKVFLNHYNWVVGLKKIVEDNKKDIGYYTAPSDEKFVVWGNY